MKKRSLRVNRALKKKFPRVMTLRQKKIKMLQNQFQQMHNLLSKPKLRVSPMVMVTWTKKRKKVKNQNMRMKRHMEKKTMMQKESIYGETKAQIGIGTIERIKKLMKEETQFILMCLIHHLLMKNWNNRSLQLRHLVGWIQRLEVCIECKRKEERGNVSIDCTSCVKLYS